ncbi:MAG: hypothetical protein AAFY49_10535 [Pseudomonadota bacterium]
MSNTANMDIEPAQLVAEAARSGALSASDTALCDDLVGRLSNPVRVTILGRDAAPRADIVNLIFGGMLLPTEALSGAVQFQYASAFACTATTQDRISKEVTDPRDLASLADEKLVFTEIGFPHALLSKISILSLSPPDDPAEFEPALNWIASRSDVVIWYSETWTALEHDFWSMVPARLKDHSFLCTSRQSTGDTLKPAFRSRFSLDIAETRRVVADGMSDTAALRACGAYDLIAAIRNDLAAARREVDDRIALLVQKYPEAMDAARDAIENGTSNNVTEIADAMPAAPAAAVYDPATLIAALEGLGTELQADASFEFKKVFRRASGILIEAADDMAASAAHCPLTDALKQRVETASDVLELVAIESDLQSCPDGIALLLQIKRDAQKLQATIPHFEAEPDASALTGDTANVSIGA